jgi:uncharacterized protein YkwD
MIRIAKFLNTLLVIFTAIVVSGTIFLTGYKSGYRVGQVDAINAESEKVSSTNSTSIKTVTNTKVVYVTPKPAQTNWGGPQLWEAVNKRRVELGVGPLSVKEEVCTIASIRLNQLLELGKLDAHSGFSNMPTARPDLKYIFDKYNLSEFLVSGASSPQNAVDLWENTLGHKELMSGGQYVWGCIYAQNGFGVAITAY